MKAHSGQVALYLVAVLIAICILVTMNVGIYLSVSAKNKAMNAGDAAALAVAKYQGELLNRIGRMNIDHLRAAIDNDEEECERLMERQLRCCFLGPISGAEGGDATQIGGGITAGNRRARENGAERNAELEELLRDHVREVRMDYAPHPEYYPPPWEGAWEEYATALELALSSGLWAGPANIDYLNVRPGHLLLNCQFYNAIAGECWCWFKFNEPDLLDSYGSFRDWPPLSVEAGPSAERCANSEVYSLHLSPRTGNIVSYLGTNLICRLAEVTESELARSYLITNVTQTWMFYGESVWSRWGQIDPHGAWQFPVVGPVKPEYNVRGCAALCRVRKTCEDLLNEGEEDAFRWTAGAKPFGTVENEEGEVDVVTACRRFVTPAFTDVRLVPIDAVGGMDLSTGDEVSVKHARKHLPSYLADGPTAISANDCWYCQQLVQWEHASFRRRGSRWLKFNGETCERGGGGEGSTGGTSHAH